MHKVESASKIRLVGPINEDSYRDMAGQLDRVVGPTQISSRLNHHDPWLQLEITSPGGTSVHALAMYNQLNLLRPSGVRLQTVVFGSAGCDALLLLMAGEHRAIHREACLEFGPIFDINPSQERLDSITTDTIRWFTSMFTRLVLEKCAEAKGAMSDDTLRQLMSSHGRLGSARAKHHGLVHEILGS